MDMTRGVSSADSLAVQDAKKKDKAAKKKGYHGVLDRYELHVGYRNRMSEAGRTFNDMVTYELLSHW